MTNNDKDEVDGTVDREKHQNRSERSEFTEPMGDQILDDCAPLLSNG